MEPPRESGREHDAAYWDERYAAPPGDQRRHQRSGGPDPTVVEVVAPLKPRRALDLACGSGRHALHLAALGWAVTAVDFSAVGVDLGREAERAQRGGDHPGGRPIEWVVADVSTWTASNAAAGATYDLVLAAFYQLPADARATVRALLAPGGRLVIVGHARRNRTDGVGGPSNPAYLHTEAQLRDAATGLTIERLDEVTCHTDRGDQISLVLVAARP